jgi:hypothetical protein
MNLLLKPLRRLGLVSAEAPKLKTPWEFDETRIIRGGFAGDPFKLMPYTGPIIPLPDNLPERAMLITGYSQHDDELFEDSTVLLLLDPHKHKQELVRGPKIRFTHRDPVTKDHFGVRHTCYPIVFTEHATILKAVLLNRNCRVVSSRPIRHSVNNGDTLYLDICVALDDPNPC